MSTPARLEKRVSAKEKREAWVNAHAHLFLPVLGGLLFLIFIWVIFTLTGLAATDSGMTYNHLMDVI